MFLLQKLTLLVSVSMQFLAKVVYQVVLELFKGLSSIL